MKTFTFKLINTEKLNNVVIDFYSSSEGYFIETSQGLVSSYFNTIKQAKEYLKTVKQNIKNEKNRV